MNRSELPQDWTDEDYYQARKVLGLTPTATAQEIADAWTVREDAAEQAWIEEART